jgi:phosphotransferase system  glucose/maltose/N-acetylglucosamine-specific IIC component
MHAFISTFAALFYAFGPPIGSYLWTLIVVFGMHVCFNMKGAERFVIFCCPSLSSSTVAPMTRHEREVAVILMAQNHCNPRANPEEKA